MSSDKESQDTAQGSQDVAEQTATESEGSQDMSQGTDVQGETSEDAKVSGAKRKFVDPDDYFPEKWPPPTPWPGVPRSRHPIVYADEEEEWIPGKRTRSTQTTPTKGYNPYCPNIRLSTKQKQKLQLEKEAAKKARLAEHKVKPQFRKFKF